MCSWNECWHYCIFKLMSGEVHINGLVIELNENTEWKFNYYLIFFLNFRLRRGIRIQPWVLLQVLWLVRANEISSDDWSCEMVCETFFFSPPLQTITWILPKSSRVFSSFTLEICNRKWISFGVKCLDYFPAQARYTLSFFSVATKPSLSPKMSALQPSAVSHAFSY